MDKESNKKKERSRRKGNAVNKKQERVQAETPTAASHQFEASRRTGDCDPGFALRSELGRQTGAAATCLLDWQAVAY